MALPLENLINVDFIPNIWDKMIIIPYLASEHALEHNSHLTSEYLSGFKKYFIYRGKMPFGFPEGNLERCSRAEKNEFIVEESDKCTPSCPSFCVLMVILASELSPI